jgi:hypothetical protein
MCHAVKTGAHLEDLVIDGSLILKWICKKYDEEAWSGLIWFSIATGGWLLLMR